MPILMTEPCEMGVDILWKQCDEDQYPRGLEYLEEAVEAGDPEALFFLGHCYSWGGAVGFNDKKAYECYKEGARAGSYRCVLGALRAGQYDDEIKEAAKYALKECYEKVLEAANEGEAFAAFQIGAAIEWESVFKILPEEEQKTENCLLWYKKAADGGIVEAMVKLGKCYLNGQFTEKDPEKAIYYADQAAARGNAWGLYRMGIYHLEHDRMEAAFAYFNAASIQGDDKAPFHLGKMYLSGNGVERDIGKAVEAFETAVAREDTRCLVELGNIFYDDIIIERDYDKAFYWYSRAYSAGEKQVALALGHLYLRPSKVQDIHKAEKLFLEAQETEQDGAASLALGHLYYDGIGREIDLKTAISYFETGAELGEPECRELLGNLYFLGDEELEPNYERAFYWFDLLEKADALLSYSKLAYLYWRGYGCEPDEERAIALFEKAAEIECDGYALYELGRLHEERGDSQEDLDIAVDYYEQALDMGYEEADERLSCFKKTLFGKWKVVEPHDS